MGYQKSIMVQTKSGEVRDALVNVTTEPLQMRFECAGFNPKVFSGRDFFSAFAKLREWLEESHIKLLCNGARVDVYPSGMSRDMGGGRKAYVLCVGQPARRIDQVDVLEYAPVEKIGSIKEQKQFYEKWKASMADR